MDPYRTDDVLRAYRSEPSPAPRFAGLLTIVVLLIAPAIAWSAPEPIAVLTLDEAYARTKARSNDLKAYEERIIEAELNVSRAWALLKPIWNASFSYVHTEPRPPALVFPPFPDFRTDTIRENCVADATSGQTAACLGGVFEALGTAANADPLVFDFARDDTVLVDTRITWNLFNGRAIPLIKNAYDAVDLERQRSSATISDLMLTVARAYYAALATQQAIGAAERARDRANEELAIATQKAELGESVGSQKLAGEIAPRQAATDVRRAENAHQQVLSAVALLTRTEEKFDVIPPEQAPERPAGDAAALKSAAHTAREDLRAAELSIVLAERTEQEAWWKFAPTLSVFGGYRWSNVAGISGQKEQWSFGLVAAAPLYDGGLRYQDIASAQSKIRAANQLLDATRARVDNDVDRALLRLEAAAMNIERAQDGLLLAQTRREVVSSQYEVGALRGIELKEASDVVLSAEVSMIRAKMDVSVATLELQRAVGVFGQ